MPTDSAVWRDLEAQFLALSQTSETAPRLTAMYGGGQWSVDDGPTDARECAQLHELFRSTARSGAIAAGVPNQEDALQWWLNLLRRESPHFKRIDGTGPGNVPKYGGWIQNVARASAKYCAVRANHAFELENTAATDDGHPPGLRRDWYPFSSWLVDHTHKPEADPAAELQYWKAHVWRGYDALIQNYESMKMAWGDRHEKLNSATAGLCYDLAVLQANYAIDRGLRGDEAMRAFREESAELLEELTSSWRANCGRLAVTYQDDTEELKDLAQPFHRVRDDLGRLLTKLPPPASPTAPATQAVPNGPPNIRESFVMSILTAKGWSILDWANDARVDFHTANDYLKGSTKPYPSTRKKLADSLGVAVTDLPA